MYIAARIGDGVETVVDVYAHEYSDARRHASEADQLAELYDRGQHHGSAWKQRAATRRNG